MNKKLHPETLAATGLGWIDPETDAMAAPPASIHIILARPNRFGPYRPHVHA